MKNIFLLLIVFISSSVFAQVEFQIIENVPESFKIKYSEEKHEFNPLHVGDLWQYDFGWDGVGNYHEGRIYTTKVTGDTIINNTKYYRKVNWRYDLNPQQSDFISWERNDSTSGNSYMLDFEDIDEDGDTLEELPLDSLELPDNSRYTSYKYAYKGEGGYLGKRMVRIVDSFWAIIFGDTVFARQVEYIELFIGEIIADKYGVVLFSYESPDRPLTAAIINGVTYGTIVSVPNISRTPFNYHLNQNYPNPFNPSTIISFELPKRSKVKLKIFDLLGREIIELVNEIQYAGHYNVEFSPSKQGLNLSSGIYLYQLITPERVITKKMIIVK